MQIFRIPRAKVSPRQAPPLSPAALQLLRKLHATVDGIRRYRAQRIQQSLIGSPRKRPFTCSLPGRDTAETLSQAMAVFRQLLLSPEVTVPGTGEILAGLDLLDARPRLVGHGAGRKLELHLRWAEMPDLRAAMIQRSGGDPTALTALASLTERYPQVLSAFLASPSTLDGSTLADVFVEGRRLPHQFAARLAEVLSPVAGPARTLLAERGGGSSEIAQAIYQRVMLQLAEANPVLGKIQGSGEEHASLWFLVTPSDDSLMIRMLGEKWSASLSNDPTPALVHAFGVPDAGIEDVSQALQRMAKRLKRQGFVNVKAVVNAKAQHLVIRDQEEDGRVERISRPLAIIGYITLGWSRNYVPEPELHSDPRYKQWVGESPVARELGAFLLSIGAEPELELIVYSRMTVNDVIDYLDERFPDKALAEVPTRVLAALETLLKREGMPDIPLRPRPLPRFPEL